MRYACGFILIRGDHASKFESLMRTFGLDYTGNQISFDSYHDTHEFLAPSQIEWKAVTYCKGWTVIVDIKVNLIFETEKLKKISKILKSPIYALSVISNTDWNQFCYVDGDKARVYLNDGGNIREDKGEPLACEAVRNKYDERPGSLDLMKAVCDISLEEIEEHKGFVLLKEFKALYY